MKKIIFCLFAAIVMSNCEMKVKESKADSKQYLMYSEIVEGMEYRIFQLYRSGHDNIFVINVTKDKLEVEKLKRELIEKP